ncbi:MAG: c-type cytochrome [Flavobacteriales bacterium]|nr:c-type cytochrome [Flavobacteriales bacterium]
MKSKMSKIAALIAGLFITNVGFAQSSADLAAAGNNSMHITLAWVIVVVAVVMLFIAWAMLRVASHLNRYAKGELAKEGKDIQPFWEKVFQVKPVTSDKDTVINHPHDGIYELDNPPPPWFMFLFYGTILFAVIYFIRFNFSESGYTQAEEYKAEMDAAKAEMDAFKASKGGSLLDESTVKLLTDKADLDKGEKIFKSTCAACHGEYGEGKIGVNLADDYWKYGGDIKSVFATISNGTSGGMPPQKMALGPEQRQLVSSYVIYLDEKNIPAGVTKKAPEGKLEQAGGEKTPSDSTAAPADSTGK